MKNKTLFFFFLFIIFLIFLFLVLLYLENQSPQETILENENSLNLGQPENTPPMQLYFCPEDDCRNLIVKLINDSNKSIDCAIYDITSKEVAEAFISEEQQGTEIRIVTDKGRSQTKSSLVGDLKVSGIEVLISPSEESYMHNKFCVFDDNISLIGSANFTESSFSKSYNNILVFQNAELSKTLKQKIDSFYLGNFSNSSTVLGKTYNDHFSIYYCPNDNCKSQILNQISSAKESIICMMYSFTLDEFGDGLVQARKKGIDIKVILESQQTSQYSEFEKLKAEDIDVIEDNNSYLMHNKFCVFDGQVITTGSMNFSKNGTNNNDETLLVISDSDLSEKYQENFYKYWNAWNKAN